MLRRSVETVSRSRSDAGTRIDEDDLPAAHTQKGQKSPRHAVRRAGVDTVEKIEVLVRRLDLGPRSKHPGRVHEHVQAKELGLQPSGESRNLVILAEVGLLYEHPGRAGFGGPGRAAEPRAVTTHQTQS